MTCTPPYIEYTDAAGVIGMRMPVNTDGTVCGVGPVGPYTGCGGTPIGDGRYCGYWPPLSMELIAHLVVLCRPQDSQMFRAQLHPVHRVQGCLGLRSPVKVNERASFLRRHLDVRDVAETLEHVAKLVARDGHVQVSDENSRVRRVQVFKIVRRVVDAVDGVDATFDGVGDTNGTFGRAPARARHARAASEPMHYNTSGPLSSDVFPLLGGSMYVVSFAASWKGNWSGAFTASVSLYQYENEAEATADENPRRPPSTICSRTRAARAPRCQARRRPFPASTLALRPDTAILSAGCSLPGCTPLEQ